MKWWPKSRASREQVQQAEARLINAKELAEQSRVVSGRLTDELALNGWTKKFQTALGRRA